MFPRIDPRGWVLIAVAGWALACAVVALTGFGGRYRLLADNPALTPRLPTVSLASKRPPLGPLSSYAEASSRPLFYADRKPIAVHVAGPSAAAQPLNVTLTSVIITPTLLMAIVQDTQTKQSLRVREGQPIGGAYAGWKLVALSPRSAVFDGGSQGQSTLDLRIFDGKGGEDPTRMGLTPQAIASGVLGPPTPPPQPSAASIEANVDAVPPAISNNSQVVPPSAGDASSNPINIAAMQAAQQAAQQAEQIRRRIEARRQQTQAQGGDTPPPNDKVK